MYRPEKWDEIKAKLIQAFEEEELTLVFKDILPGASSGLERRKGEPWTPNASRDRLIEATADAMLEALKAKGEKGWWAHRGAAGIESQSQWHRHNPPVEGDECSCVEGTLVIIPEEES